MTADLSTKDALSAAARLLRLVAEAPGGFDDLVRLRCLSAVMHLDATGQVVPFVDVERGDVPDEMIRDALRILAALPISEFSRSEVLDAASDARRALLLLG